MNRVAIFTLAVLLVLFLATLKAYPAEEAELEKLTPPKEAQDLPVEEDKSGLVTMDFEGAEIHDVIRVIAMASGMNIAIGEDVQAKVTISLKQVHWERALDVILRTYNFTYKKEENLIRIMTFEKLKQEERDIPLVTKVVYLNFAKVSDIQGTLSKMLSDRGSIEVDTRTNGMLVTDIPEKVNEVELIAMKLDTRTPQVLIEAMLIDVKLTEDDELGINWKIIDYFGSDSNQDAGRDTPDYIEQPSGMNIANEAIKFGWIQRIGQYKLDGLIKAWVQDAKANVLASPKIVTLDNQTAKIEIKDQVAYTQSTQNDAGGTTTSTQFKDVITGIEVTPHITREGFVSMNLKPKQEYVDGTVGGEPKIASRSAETNVLVKDGETIVIGGLRKIEDNITITKVPFLGDIPILGKLFRKEDSQRVNTELVMFVTPRVIIKPKLTEEEIDRFKMLEESRGDFLKYLEKEKESRRSAQQSLLISPEIAEDESIFEEEATEIAEEENLPSPAIKEEETQPQEKEEYIYSW